MTSFISSTGNKLIDNKARLIWFKIQTSQILNNNLHNFCKKKQSDFEKEITFWARRVVVLINTLLIC